jgi:hypothetical protein
MNASMKIRRLFLAMALMVAAASHAENDGASAEDVERLLGTLAGEWSNAAQYRDAPGALKVEPSVEGDWIDLQHAAFHAVDAPKIGEHVLYLEWRRGGPEGPVSRQRLWSFRIDADGLVRMDFFAFVDGADFVGRGSQPGAFSTVDAKSLRSYSPDCALRFSAEDAGGWVGRIGSDECRIVAASGRGMGIDARVALTDDGSLSFQESGRLDDGRYAFRVPPTMPYLFQRIGGHE